MLQIDSFNSVGTVKPRMSSYLWEIRNFSTVCKNIGGYYESPLFSTKFCSTEHQWCLQLYTQGHQTTGIENIWIDLSKLGKVSVPANVTISLLDDKFCKLCKKHTFKNIHWGLAGFRIPLEEIFVTNNTNRILVPDTIIILCEITYDLGLAEPLQIKQCMDQDSPDYCRLKEFDEFEKLLEAEHSADVIVRIGKDEIKVHKLIITTRSPVFQVMFEHNMKEKEQNVIEITDIKYEVMKEVVRFMYAGKVHEIENIAGDLLIAADKYSIEGLRLLCEKQLFKNLTVTNAIDYLKLAITYNAVDLKSKIIKFIVKNQKDFIEKPELQQLPVEIVCEVFSAVVRYHSNK